VTAHSIVFHANLCAALQTPDPIFSGAAMRQVLMKNWKKSQGAGATQLLSMPLTHDRSGNYL
jgi:hypothetical protein